MTEAGEPGQEPDLLYGALQPAGCAALLEACPEFFAARAVAPLEVLLRPELLSELSDSAEAPQAAAALVAAAGATGAFPDAVGTFIALRRELARRQAALKVPEVSPETMPAVARATAKRLQEPERSFSMLSALVRMSPPDEKPAVRLARLVACLGARRAHEAVAEIDRVLGALLARPNVARHLFPARLPVAARISALLDAAEGREGQLAESSAVLAALVESESYARLGETRQGARAAAVALLGEPGQLRAEARRSPAEVQSQADAEPLDLRALADELAAMRDLGRRIRRMAGAEEERRLRGALRSRASWLLQEQVLASVLAGLDPYQGLRALFDLQATAADFDLRPVDDRLRRLLGHRNLSAELRTAVPGVPAQLRMYGDLKRLAEASSFPPPEQERLVRMFDGFQLGVLKRSQMLAGIASDKEVDIDLMLQLADLCAAGVIADGEARDAAHRALQRTVRRPLFFRTVLEQESEGGSRVERLEAVLGRLRSAGIACRSPQDLRILVTDDESGARKFVEMVLHEFAVGEVLVATDGGEALELFEAQDGRVDMVIADWRMPRMSGLDLLKRIRKTHPDMPFLMMTALATVPAVREAMHFEVDGYLAKPFPPEQLEEKILTLINR